MTLTIQKITEVMNQVNQEAFGGQLNLSGIEVGISNAIKMVAHVTFSRPNFFNGFVCRVTNLKVSRRYPFNEEQLKNTIAHELIHVYEAQVLKQKPSHGDAFYTQLNRLNSMGYNVTVRETELKPTIPNKDKNLIYVLSEDRSKMVITTKGCLISMGLSKGFQKTFANCHTGEIKGEIVKNYACMRKYRGYYPVTPAQLQALGL